MNGLLISAPIPKQDRRRFPRHPPPLPGWLQIVGLLLLLQGAASHYVNLDVARQIDRQGRITSNQYDAIRELIQTTDPLGRTTKYTWCTCGGLSTLTDANGNVTTWNLDTLGRVTGKVYADSSQITYTYESSTSRLHQMTDALGSTSTYAYNLDNTLAGTTYVPASGVSATPNVSFGYDPVYNRVTYMADGTGTTTYSYAPITGTVTTGAGRLSSVSVPIASSTGTITYSYDQLGRVTGRSIDGATTNANNVSTTFDALGRVTGVTNATGSFTYSYVDTTGRLAEVIYPNGQKTDYTYFDNTGDQRLKEINNYVYGLLSNTPLSDFQYTYNAVGTIASWQQQTDANTPTQYALGYDAADQLTSAVQSVTGTSTVVSSNGYNYDPAGNRLAETTLTGTMGGQFNHLNQLTAYSSSLTSQTVTGTLAVAASVTVNAVPATMTTSTNFTATVPLPSGTNVLSVVAQDTGGNVTTKRFSTVTSGPAPTALAYDANGNTTTDENGNSYSWDALNRLKKITYPSGAKSEFCYDGLSRRTSIIEKDASGTVTSTKNYLWIGSEIAEERDASNTVTKRFFPQGEQQSGTNYYYTTDHLGSVREMLNSSGSIVARYAYDDYGNTTLVAGSDLASFGYAGMQKDPVSGLYMTLYRIYDAIVGLWRSRDPIGENGGVNLYSYVGNSPTNAYDPLGLRLIFVIIWNSPGYNGSVGHVMATELNGNVILSQFPANGDPYGTNIVKTVDQSRAYDKRDPDRVFVVNVPDDKAFDDAAANRRSRANWFAIPLTSQQTNCVRSVTDALQAGGVPVKGDIPYVWPGGLTNKLIDLEQTHKPSDPWSVTPSTWSAVPHK